jgi:hypothetical protein
MSFIFIVVLRTRKRLTFKDVAAVKGLRIKNQNTLFSLGMLTYAYELQDMIQIALKTSINKIKKST